MTRDWMALILWISLSSAPPAGFAAAKGPWKEASVKVGDIKIRYLEAGSGDRTMVFLPGLSMIAEVWQEQIPYFAARGFRVLAYDPRSHGETTRTEEGNTYQQHAADLHAFLKLMKIEEPILVGWSAGVVTLLEYVSSPESVVVEKLVLVDGAPTGFKDDDYPHGATFQQARSAVLSLQDDREKTAESFVRGMFKGSPPEYLLTDLIKGSLKTPTGTLAALYFDLFTGDRRPALLRIQSPTLVVVPDSKRLLGEYLQSKIGGSSLAVIEDAGHALFLEKPQAFNQALESFVAGGSR